MKKINRTFFDYVIDEPDPSAMVTRLLSDEETFWGEKDLLLTAFITYLHFPDELENIQNLVLIYAARKIGQLEKKFERKYNDALLGEIKLRQSPRYAPLFSEVYHALGGLTGLMHRRSYRMELRDLALRRDGEASSVYRLMAILHFQRNSIDKGFETKHKPSLNRAIRAHMELFEGARTNSREGLLRHWAIFKSVANFIYAGLASTSDHHAILPPPYRKRCKDDDVLVDSESILGDFFYKGPRFSRDEALFRMLLARATYANDYILRPVFGRNLSSAVGLPATISCQQIPVPDLDNKGADIVLRVLNQAIHLK